MKLFEKLYNHLYTTIHDEARKRMSLDSVARRNGIILPGIWTGDERPRWPLQGRAFGSSKERSMPAERVRPSR
jgi:hypothetical protein